MTDITSNNDPTDIVRSEINTNSAVYELLPRTIRNALDKHLEIYPHLFVLDEVELKKELKAERQPISVTDNQIRFSFWMEYRRAINLPTPALNFTTIITDICSLDYFYTKYITMPYRMAWMLCKPASYDGKLGEAVSYGIDYMREILDMPAIKPDGTFDHKLAEMKIKVTVWLDQRLHGSIVQRSEQKNLNVQLTSKDKDIIHQITGSKSETDLKNRIKQLESANRKIQHLPATEEKEVTNESAIIEKTDN